MASQEKINQSLHYALETVDDTTCFVFHEVKPEFYPGGPFSSVQLELQVSGGDGCQHAMKFSTLFKVDVTDSKCDAAREFIHCCRNKEWPPFDIDMKSEQDVMLAIASEILVHISPEVTMEKRYRRALSSLVSCNPNVPKTLTTSALGMGNKYAWHGTIDTRARGSVVISKGEEEEELENQSESENESSSGEQSDGTTTNLEDKIKYKACNLPQVVAICVVSSYTEKASHPDMSSFIPTIMIDKMSFRICLFDCKKDVLLISNKKSLCTKGHLSPSGIALLWVVFNHR